MRKRWLLSLTGALLLSAGLVAPAEARTRQRVSATEVQKNTRKVLDELPWVPDLETARTVAARQKKLVFYLQIVGELSGGL